MNIKHLIDAVEKLFLITIAVFTVIAMGQEIWLLIENRRVALQDLLLMFIAMTALSRLIVLQGKDSDPIVLLYEAGAILLIAVACWVTSRMRPDE